jgi:hypothetical protein
MGFWSHLLKGVLLEDLETSDIEDANERRIITRPIEGPIDRLDQSAKVLLVERPTQRRHFGCHLGHTPRLRYNLLARPHSRLAQGSR